jgi:putative membrane protein
MISYNPDLYWRHIIQVRGTRIERIFSRVLPMTIWAFVIEYGQFDIPFSSTTSIVTIIGSALGFLLVFRINASNERYWEGRKLWGGMINTSRNLARSTQIHLINDRRKQEEIVVWIIVFAYSTIEVLRKRKGIGPMARRLPSKEVEWVLSTDHVPFAVATRITGLLKQANDEQEITDIVYLTMDNMVKELIDILGGCERIHNTPLPFSCMVHLRRALVVFSMALPFGIISPHWYTSVAECMILNFIFFGIEEIGVEIEDPFGEDDNDLPLERFCETIERNLMALAQQPIPD